LQFVAHDDPIFIDEGVAEYDAVAESEKRTGFRNIALANYMKSFGVLDNPIDFALSVFWRQPATKLFGLTSVQRVCLRPQARIAAIIGPRSRPLAVSTYSARGGLIE
jgi:hypothetical protein